MPTDLNFITIKQSQFDEQPGINYCCRLTFKITDQNTRTICVEFEDEFIEDFYGVTSNNDMQKNIPAEKNFLFNLGLIRIEQMINDQTLDKVIRISQKDIPWAKKVKNGTIIPSSNKTDEDFKFYPQKKIGF